MTAIAIAAALVLAASPASADAPATAAPAAPAKVAVATAAAAALTGAVSAAAGSPAGAPPSPGPATATAGTAPDATPAASPSAAASAAKLAAVSPAAPPPFHRIVDRVAATVNGDVITLRDLQDRAGAEYQRAERLPAGPEREQAVRAALRRAFDQMVSERLFHAQAVLYQVDVNDQQVNGAIEDIKKRNNFDDRMLDQALAEQGTDRAGFREQVRRDLESYRILDYKVRSRVKVTDEDMRVYYRSHPSEFGGEEELHVRHIFIPVAPDAPPDAVERARAAGEAALQRLATGEAFARVAKEVSRGPGADEGGDLGWLRRGTIDPRLEEIAFALKDGEVSKLVRSGPGFHLFEVDGRRLSGGRSFEAARDSIRERLSTQQTQSYRDQYVAELKRDAVIETDLPELKD